MAEKIDLSTISVDWAKYIDKDFKRHRIFPFTAEKAVFGQNGKLLSKRLQDIEDSISDAFSDIKDYVVGDYCIYLNGLYRFTEAKPAGPWDGAKVVPVSISQVLKEIDGRLSDLNAKLLKYVTISIDTISNSDSAILLPDEISNDNFCIPIIYGHTRSNNVIENIFFDTSGGKRYLHVFSNVTQTTIVRIFYIQ